MRTEIFFTESPWLILPCILLGILGAWLLYAKSASFDRKIRLILGLIRGSIIALICFLLIGLLLRYTQSTIEKTKAVILVDNSLSMAPYRSAVLQSAKRYGAIFQEQGYDVQYRSLSNRSAYAQIDSIEFDVRYSDLSQLLEGVRSDFEGLHLTDVVVLSDGIINKGANPSYSYYPFKIHTVAFGDSIPKVDVQIKQVTANQVAYLGNEFPISVDIVATGMKGKSSQLVLKQRDKILHTQKIDFDNEDYYLSKSMQVTANQKGIQNYTVEIEPLATESFLHNNRKEIYLDVIDAQEKILLLAAAPHPDLKAIKSAIEASQNVEVEIKILSLATSDDRAFQQTPYDVVILHQLPSVDGVGNGYIDALKTRNTSLFVVVGAQSNLAKVNELLNGVIQFPIKGGQFDRVTGSYNNSSFQLFKLESEPIDVLDRFPPLIVPFGDYQVRNQNEVLLHQKVGNVKTAKPLLLAGAAPNQKVAVLVGEGIWRWRLEEFAMSNKQELVDEILQKVVQFLSIKDDKRKFRVYPLVKEVVQGDKAVLKVEVYNDIYEPIYGQEVTIRLQKNGEDPKEYQYIHTSDKPYFELSGLQEGVYQFTASTRIGTKEEIAAGQFVVIENNVELYSLQANYPLLKTLATNSNGVYNDNSNSEEAMSKVIESKSPSKLKSKEEIVDMIEFKWILLGLLLLLTTEWSIRKYNGQY